MEKMNAETRIKLMIGSMFVENQALQDQVQKLTLEIEELKKSAEKVKANKS